MIRFDRNECPLPPPDHVLRAIHNVSANDLRRYPAELQGRFVAELAKRLGVQTANIVLGSGADDVLAALIRAFAHRDDAIVIPRPSFEMYSLLAESSGIVVRHVTYELRWVLDPDAVVAAADHSTKLVILGNPNNPTGDALQGPSLMHIASSLPTTLIIVDEVYASFSDHSLVKAARKFPNVIAVGSLSKTAALAGMRIGFAVAHEPIVSELRDWMCPFPLSSLSLAGAIAYVSGGAETEAFDLALRAQVRRSLDAIVDAVQPLAQAVWRSCGNFVLCDFGRRAHEVREALSARGIASRSFSDPMLQSCVRFCAADDAATQTLVTALREEHALSNV